MTEFSVDDEQLETGVLTKEQQDDLAAVLDPVIWCQATLKDPENPNKFLDFRDYQAEALSYNPYFIKNAKGELLLQNRIKVLRMGRRVGKTVLLAAEAIHKTSTNANFRIIYIAPFEAQCNIFFGIMEKMINGTVIKPTSFRKKPYFLQLPNGSTITGYTANVRSSRKGSSIRGAEGDHIIVDEMDHGIDEVINEVIMPIYMGNNITTITAASTPSGRRGLFYLWCNSSEELGIKEYYIPSQRSPKWNSESEKLALMTMTKEQYTHEILAEFGEAAEGVFRNIDLDAIMKTYDYKDLKRNPENLYIMGVDWNETFGVCIVIIEKSKKTGFYRLFKHVIIEKQELTQLAGVNKIIDMHLRDCPCNFIYVDKGYGNCVGPDTSINTISGVKKIIDINIGDQVLTYDGSYRLVKDKIIREDAKQSYIIKPVSCVPTVISNSHPFLIYRTTNKQKYKEIIDESKLLWVKCPEINKVKDLVAIAKTKNINAFEEGKKCIIDLFSLLLPKLSGLKCDTESIWLESSYIVKDHNYNSVLELANICKTSVPTISRIRKKIRDRKEFTKFEKMIYNEYKKYFIEPEFIKFPRYIDLLSSDFQRVYGWYLSEGNCNASSFEISQKVGNHIDEIDELILSLKNLFGRQVVVYESDIIQVVVHGKIVSTLMELLGGKYSQNKAIHPLFMERAKNIGLLIRCIFHGDGHINKHGYEISLASFSLIYQIRQVLIDNGILGCIYNVKKRNVKHKEQAKLAIQGNDSVLSKFSVFTGLSLIQNGGVQRTNFIETEHYFLVGIRKFEKISKMKGLVDISVESTQSFCGNGIVLHNTQIELIKSYGMKNPSTNLHKIIKPIDYGGKIQIKDPVTNLMTDKPAKPFLVSNTQLAVEGRQVFIPESEDTDTGIVGQMRQFSVTKISSTGNPVYDGKNNDHSLNAMMLALCGFTVEYENIVIRSNVVNIASVLDFMIPKVESRNVAVQDDNILKFRRMLSRNAPNFKSKPDERISKIAQSMGFVKAKDSSNKVNISRGSMPRRSTF